jgi:hypothetical protein
VTVLAVVTATEVAALLLHFGAENELAVSLAPADRRKEDRAAAAYMRAGVGESFHAESAYPQVGGHVGPTCRPGGHARA